MKLYCLVGRITQQPLSYRGKVIVHGDKTELEYLFPASRVVELPAYYGEDLTIPLTLHPDMDTVKFPLAENMNQFRRK